MKFNPVVFNKGEVMNEIKNLQNSVMNQMKYITDEAKDNVVSIQKKAIQNNPMNSQMLNWQIAQGIRYVTAWVMIPLLATETYWSTWHQVFMYPKGEY